MPAVLSDAHGPAGEPLSSSSDDFCCKPNTSCCIQAARWAAEGTGWIHAYLLWDWADTYNRIAQVNNVELRYDPPDQTRNNARFYVVDLLSELEWVCWLFLLRARLSLCSLH